VRGEASGILLRFPIAAPRRAPALCTAVHDGSKTWMQLQGPQTGEAVPASRWMIGTCFIQAGQGGRRSAASA
jgi:hypothetical protein